jgi:signal transduction histidine kinase
MPPNHVAPGRIGRLLPFAFGVIAALFAATNLAALDSGRVVYQRTRNVVADTLASVELISRMGRDLDRVRLLVDEHVFEKEAFAMQAVELRLAQVQSDFRSAAEAYRELAGTPEEQRVWRQIDADTKAIQAPIDRALALSRGDRDVEARAAMVALNQKFADIDQGMLELIAINRTQAAQAGAKIGAIQHSASEAMLVLGIAGIGIALAVALWTTRLVRRTEEILRGYTAALETQNRELDAFAGRVAHDIRGPLSTVKLAAAQLQRRNPEDERSFALLQRGISRMLVLIEDLLALSRVGEAIAATCDPADASRGLVEDLAAQHPEARLRMTVDGGEAVCKATLLRQALWNLVENAVKYRRAEAQPEIEITGRAIGDDYVMRIADNGMGMSEADTKRAFEPFFRADATRERPGTGLGLSIVKRVVEAAGGQVSIESTVGCGTAVTLRLVRATASDRRS